MVLFQMISLVFAAAEQRQDVGYVRRHRNIVRLGVETPATIPGQTMADALFTIPIGLNAHFGTRIFVRWANGKF